MPRRIGRLKIYKIMSSERAGLNNELGILAFTLSSLITIIILDTKLVPDFVLHAFCFSIGVNRLVLINATTKYQQEYYTRELRPSKIIFL